MASPFTGLVRSLLGRLGLGVVRASRLRELEELSGAGREFRLMLALPEAHLEPLMRVYRQSRAQLRQDLFVLSTLDFKRDGYFVEFGATNGYDLSNTHLLEKQFGWKGIVAEPAARWHEALRANRSAIIETDCVWTSTGDVINFSEADDGELSTISAYTEGDVHRHARAGARVVPVRTISLTDLLVRHRAPAVVDYLSIDTEGSEYDILRHFDFDRFAFRVITCEHNFTSNRARIHALLTGRGYRRVLEEFSGFDDWYVGPS